MGYKKFCIDYLINFMYIMLYIYNIMGETVKENIKTITSVLVTIALFFSAYAFNNMADQLNDLSKDVKDISETVIELKTNVHYIGKDQDNLKLEMQVLKGEHTAIIRKSTDESR